MIEDTDRHSDRGGFGAVRRRLISSFRHRLTSGVLSYGVFVVFPDANLVELWAKAGFDFVVVDLEHSTIGLESADSLIVRAIECGLPPLVRVARGDERILQRCLDAGAAGVVVAGVESRSDLDEWWTAATYPPLGRRGVAQVRANSWGSDEMGDPGDCPLFVPMIESQTAIAQIDELLSFPNSDWWHLGLVDLGADLRRNPDAVQRDELVSRVADAARRKGMSLGLNRGLSLPSDIRLHCLGVTDRELVVEGAKAWKKRTNLSDVTP